MRVGRCQRQPFIAFALLAAAALAHAEYKDDYAHGLKAYRDGQFAEARKLMQQALDEHAEPAERIRLYGQVYEPYLPQHYAGMAAFKLGDCASAIALWDSAPNRQIVAQLAEPASEEKTGAAACAQKGVAKKEEKPPTIPIETPPPKTVVVDNKPPKPLAPPPKPVEVPKPPPEKPPVAVRNTPPEPLVQAFVDYLAGHYTEVGRINPDSYADNRARFHAYLVRAAAKFTLARMSGDDAMLKAARADATAARALDAQAIPDATFFSPAFRAFYAGDR